MKKEDKERMDRTEREFYAAVEELQERVPTGQDHYNITSEGSIKYLAKALGTGMAMLSDRIEASDRLGKLFLAGMLICSAVIAAATIYDAYRTFWCSAPSAEVSSEEAPSRKPEGPKHD